MNITNYTNKKTFLNSISLIKTIKMEVNMIRKNKRGVEAIVGTILVLLIAIAVAGILWQVVVPMVKKGATQSELASTCLSADVKIVSRDSYYKSTDPDGNLTVVVSRGAGELDLRDVQVIAYDTAGNSEPILVKETEGYEVLAENAQKVYKLNTSSVIPSKAAVAVKVRIGEETKLCNPSEKVEIESL